MPNDEKDLELEKLKGDPNMWMRLTMLSEDGRTMQSVFTDKENPFIKNSAGAMDKIQSLAGEGRLYLREEGRSRHFHAVNKDGDSLKLGEQREMKMANTASDPVLGVLMWMSKHYFRWIGLDSLSKWLGFNGISNWFEKKLQDRRDAIEVDDRYSKEYKAMSDGKKKELNAIRKHEKIMKKLEKIQKEAELSEQTLNELRGQQAPTTTQQAPTTTQQEPTAPQQQAPLIQPPEIQPNENTMQPTLTGDAPVQQIPPAPPLPNQFTVKQTTQQEIPGTKKEENEHGENTRDNKITINGVELTDETINQFPPHVVEAFRVIQQMIVETEANKQANQQTVQQNVEEQLNENQPNELDMGSINDIDEQQIENTDDLPEVTGGTLEQISSNNPVQPTADEKVPDQEIDSPLKNGADLEPDQINMQQRHEDQAQMNLQERLAAEKETMESVVNWQERLSNTLFSNEEVSTVKDYYNMIKDGPDGQNLLAGTVCGLLSAAGDPESKKQIMEGLLSGKPLGNEHNSRINESVTAYNSAVEQMSQGNREPMTKLITDAALELGRQASQEDGLSLRHVMIGRMISNAMSLADQHSLRLNYNEEQWATIRGAAQLSELAQRHHNAKQFLGREPMDVSSKDGRKAVRDLLMGNAVENLIKVGKYHGQQTTDVQLLMGSGCLTVESLTKMMNRTQIRKDITEDRVRDIMEMPKGFDSARTAKQLGEELLTIAREATDTYGRNRQMDMQRENQPENEQQLDPAQLQQAM